MNFESVRKVSAHPFTRFRTLREIGSDLATNHQCRFAQMEGGLKDPSGRVHAVWYLERNVDGKLVQVVVGSDLDERPLPSMLNNLCRRLHLDPAIFGLAFG